MTEATSICQKKITVVLQPAILSRRLTLTFHVYAVYWRVVFRKNAWLLLCIRTLHSTCV